MNRKLIAFGVIAAAISFNAQAFPEQPSPMEPSSPVLQLAHRVASMENSKDLPSRAFWLSKLAAASTIRLAYQNKSPAKSKNKKSHKLAD
jgi:hypothetical protein